MNNEELLNKSCITCRHFAWLDGDYCCTKKMRILQEAAGGEFTKDILLSLKLNRDCTSYNEQENKNYKDKFIKLLNNLNR